MAHPILYNVNSYAVKGNDHIRHINKTAQDKEKDVTARPRVQAWQKRLKIIRNEADRHLIGGKIVTEDACDTQ